MTHSQPDPPHTAAGGSYAAPKHELDPLEGYWDHDRPTGPPVTVADKLQVARELLYLTTYDLARLNDTEPILPDGRARWEERREILREQLDRYRSWISRLEKEQT